MYNKEYYLKNKDKYKRSTYKYLNNNVSKRYIILIRNRCKKYGIEFNLTEEDIVIPEYCPLLKIKLTPELGGGLKDSQPSVDRIDPSKGYVKGNVWVISHLANRMKQGATPEQLQQFAESILSGAIPKYTETTAS